ncbi:hypothetical protein EB155_09305 [archaeon]|nr:hypothetical protein [archaeon]NDB80050.1 hypothetical protein [archaeon]
MIFWKTKLINRLFERVQELEDRVDILHKQNLNLIEMIGHLQNDISYLKAKNLAKVVEDEVTKKEIMSNI